MSNIIAFPTWRSHPSDELLEGYAVAGRHGVSIEEHLLVCPACLDRLIEMDFVIRSTRVALKHFDVIHQTAEGLVRVWCEPYRAGWAARLEGELLGSLRPVASAESAAQEAREAFSQMFPDHTCTAECGVTPDHFSLREIPTKMNSTQIVGRGNKTASLQPL